MPFTCRDYLAGFTPSMHTPSVTGLTRISHRFAGKVGALSGLALALFAGVAIAEIPTPPRGPADSLNAIAVGISYGEQTDNDADFRGWSIDYGRLLNETWAAGLSIAWDEETERFPERPSKIVRSYHLVGAISYNLSARFALTAGIAKQIADDDNDSRSMKLGSGDTAAGVSAGYTLPINLRNSIGASVAWEYNLSQNEPSVSIHLTFGWGF